MIKSKVDMNRVMSALFFLGGSLIFVLIRINLYENTKYPFTQSTVIKSSV